MLAGDAEDEPVERIGIFPAKVDEGVRVEERTEFGAHWCGFEEDGYYRAVVIFEKAEHGLGLLLLPAPSVASTAQKHRGRFNK